MRRHNRNPMRMPLENMMGAMGADGGGATDEMLAYPA